VAQLRRLDPVAAQQRVLRRLLRAAAATRFGAAHGFAQITTVAEYQAKVPLRDYEAFWREWWQASYPVLRDVSWPGLVPYFALSSGTTSGRTKYIPVTREMVRANRRAGFDVLAWHFANRPESRIFGGFAFMLGGSTALEEVAPGIRQGDLSGIAAAEVPRSLSRWSWPPPELALEADWDRKLASLAAKTPAEQVHVLTGVPSWLLMLLERMPPPTKLELLVHGGVPWGPYRERLLAHLPAGCDTREVYPASEGFIASADRGDGEGLRLNLDRGLFLEFVPTGELGRERPTRHWVGTIELGQDYAVVVTSCAGLWSYVLGDTVKFVSLDPPRLLVTGRTSYYLSAFGEHLHGGEIEAALLAVAPSVREYTVGPVFAGARGHHLWLVESTAPVDALALDAELCRRNADYAAHREGGQMSPAEVVVVPPGRFEAWMRAQGKLGGQHKVPRVIADPARFAAAAAALQA
jgi:hypothetical protein